VVSVSSARGRFSILLYAYILRAFEPGKESKMKIEVLGMGCANCNKLYQNTVEAVRLSGREIEVVKVEDIKKIMNYGVLSTPALAIDGVVKVAGKVPKVDDIKEWLK
jgi:small redox-active disulfide protein 2